MNNETAIAPNDEPQSSTSLRQRLLNILATPGEVFDEVVAAPVCLANWRVPTLMVCLVSAISLRMTGAAIPNNSIAVTQEQNEMLAGFWPIISTFMACVSVFAGTIWCAFVLWFIGRVFLRTRFSFLKTLEVVGLTGTILMLGSIVTTLLIAATGDRTAQPALSLLLDESARNSKLANVLNAVNAFHLWTTAVLAVGLSKLSGVSVKEAAFWTFGYWFFARTALNLLA